MESRDSSYWQVWEIRMARGIGGVVPGGVGENVTGRNGGEVGVTGLGLGLGVMEEWGNVARLLISRPFFIYSSAQLEQYLTSLPTIK